MHLQRTQHEVFAAELSADQLDLVPPALGPALVLAQEHLRPIASLSAAGAGVDTEVGIAGVVFAVGAICCARLCISNGSVRRFERAELRLCLLRMVG